MEKKDIEKLTKLGKSSSFVVNGQWRCTFAGHTFNGWKQSNNSPALMSEAYVDVVANDGELLQGCVSVLKDQALADEIYAFLHLKHPLDEKWEQMFNMTSISFE